MDDDDEDFEALFFAEAKELLETLLEQLNLLAEGEEDSETIHAAFRAVHSVKGGAAAFGFERLINFAHLFETVMDRIRENQLDPDADILNLLLRSGDMMQILVEDAQNGTNRDDDTYDRLMRDLAVLAGEEVPGGSKAAVEAEGAAAEGLETEPEPDDEVPATSSYLVRITPDEDFFAAGHDVLKLIRSARDLGLREVHVIGSVPTLDAFDPMACPVGFELVFESADGIERLEDFFRIYEHIATVEFVEDELSAEEDEDTAGTVLGADAAAGSGFESADAGQDDGAPEPEAVAEEAAKPAMSLETADKPSRPAHGGDASSSKSLRVDLNRIDRLVNLVGEMLISQAALAQLVSDDEEAGNAGLATEIDGLSRLLRELQESVMAIRAQPVKSVFRRMPRVVRDLADKLGKSAKLELAGENTEVDATVIEELTEPLTHMIRNAMDHGLELPEDRVAAGKQKIGRIWLSAEHHGEKVAIVVEDDGKGVDRERVYQKALERGLIAPEDNLSPEEIDNLIFHPGFSTAAEVSSVSGRGVGMDVVKKKIMSLGGRCAFESHPGKGTKFTITLPLTLAVMDGMTVSVGDQHYILPLSSVVEALRVPADGGRWLPDGTRLLERRGEYLRLVHLRSALDMPESTADTDMAIVVDTELSGPVAVVVDELIGQRQVVLKSLETNFRHVEGVSGATIMGDGNVALILDIPTLVGAAPAAVRSMNEVFH